MSYISSINDALDYIEANLGGTIDYNVAGKIACMSKSSLQKTFLFAADMTLSEYIRRRRLSCAAEELAFTEDKVIDIALKYGYDSAAAFSRAFKEFFDETPSIARIRKAAVSFPRIKFHMEVREGEMMMNEKTVVRIEEHVNEKVISFDVDCYDAEEAAWGKMSEWCRKYISDRTARRYIGVAPKGHHPDGGQHADAEEHVSHPYSAMMLLVGDEAKQEELYGMPVQDAPEGLFLVNDVVLNQYDQKGNLDMALSMIKASEAFVEFVNNTEGYEFDMAKGIFYEEHVFSERWFNEGGTPDAFKMWVPVIKSSPAA